jgi:ATP-binding cassette subfamily C protein LapB
MYLAYLLGLDATVRRLPDGYATVVGGAAGGVLTVGIRQQVAIIRALVGEPRLILFDEANLPLDAANGRRLRDLLAGMKNHAALVLTGGDAEFLALADRRLSLAEGRLVPGESS